jgi:hypothetical protein
MGVDNTRRTNWDVTWGTTALGLVDEVMPDAALVMSDIKIGSHGNMVLGQRVEDLQVRVKVQMREVTRTLQATLTPWYDAAAGGAAPATDIVPLAPAVNTDLYSLAKQLTLHPHDIAAGTKTQDIVFFKAVPISSPARLKRTGTQDDVWEVEFAIYPDRSKIGTVNNPWGTFGQT